MSDLQALYSAIYTLLAGGSEVWETRIYADTVPPGTAYPFIQLVLQAGGDTNTNRTKDPQFTIAVQCVTDSQQTALDAADRLSALLDDKGALDVSSGYLNGGSDWVIRTATRTLRLHVPIAIGTTTVYSSGYQFVFTMQEK